MKRFLLPGAALAGIAGALIYLQVRNPKDPIFSQLVPRKSSCMIGNPATCPPEKICALLDGGKTECIPRYVGPKPHLSFPFSQDHPVICTLGPETLTKEGMSHASPATLYALNFSTVDPKTPAGTVYAGFEGTAVVYQKCSQREVDKDGKPVESENDERGAGCGNGFGNHVRILNPEGYMVTYANLGSIWVQDNQAVKEGDSIGMEGFTGNASRRQLQISVHFTPPSLPWLDTLSYYRSHPGATPPSIPFEISYCNPKGSRQCVHTRKRMDQISCGGDLAKAVQLRGELRK